MGSYFCASPKLLDDPVVPNRDLPEQRLHKGDLGAVVEVYESDELEVEFVTASGKTEASMALSEKDLQPVGDRDLISVNRLDGGA